MRIPILLLAILFLNVELFAASNPFMIDANQRDFQAQQKNKGKKYLSAERIALPSNARELKSVILTLQNLDGTVTSRELKVDKTIDWHYPITITQEGAIRNIAKRYFTLNDFEFLMDGQTLIISSPKHRLIRHFLLVNPTTIIVDFSRDKGSAYDGKIGTGEKVISDIQVSVRADFYRVTIILDGIYQYNLKNGKNNSYIITIK